MRTLVRVLVLLGLAAAMELPAPRPAAAQQEMRVGSCRVLPGTRRAVGRTVGNSRVVYMSRPRLACQGGVRINADSLVSFEATGFNQLFGSVFFEDADRRLVSRNARYFDQVGRLEAEGNVELTDKSSGNIVRGENLRYIRAIPPGRPEEQLTVWGGRSQALLFPGAARDTAAVADTAAVPEGPAPARTPYDVTAERIFLRGESYFLATGTVEVQRDSLHAFADTLEFEELGERLLLTRDARVEQAEFDLSGREIMIHVPGDTIRAVEARGEAQLLGEDLDLDAPKIRMGFNSGQLEILWATPLRPGQEVEMAMGLRTLPEELDSLDLKRPEARSADFRIVADSVQVDAPGEVLERLAAVGAAQAVSTSRDSLNTPDTPELIRNDWIRGDTVLAFFDRVAGATEADSASYVLNRLEARGRAASLYRLESDSTAPDPEASATDSLAAPADTAAAAPPPVEGEPGAPGAAEAGDSPIRRGREPAVHYVTAQEIIIVFLDGQVERMEVRGLEQGIHLDPNGRVRSRGATGGGGP